MTIERNRLVRLATKVFDKTRIYDFHDRLLNKKFDSIQYKVDDRSEFHPEPLGGLQQNGVSQTTLQKLHFGDREIEGLWNEYHEWSDKLDGFGDQEKLGKFYERKKNPNRLTVLDQNSWLYRIGTDDRLANLARVYFGGRGCSLFYADYWYTMPMIGGRIASQKWHRDNEDSRLLKVFIYLNDVDERNGCFEFVRKSSKGLEHEGLKPRYRVSSSVSAAESTIDFISDNNYLIFKGVGKKDDVILCDTTGFHRGGFVEEGRRKIAHFIYTSSKCPHIFYSVKDQNGRRDKIFL